MGWNPGACGSMSAAKRTRKTASATGESVNTSDDSISSVEHCLADPADSGAAAERQSQPDPVPPTAPSPRHAPAAVHVVLLRRGRQVVELHDRVGLGPDSELPRVFEGVVLRVDDLGAVEEDLDVIADHLHRELVPDAGCDLAVPAFEPDPPALDHVVQ